MLRIIKSRFNITAFIDNPLAISGNLFRKTPGKRPFGILQRKIIVRRYDIRYGFRFGKINPSGKVCLFRKFPGLGRPRPCCDYGIENLVRREKPAVAVDFNGVFRRIGMGRPENRNENLVNIFDMSVMNRIGCRL